MINEQIQQKRFTRQQSENDTNILRTMINNFENARIYHIIITGSENLWLYINDDITPIIVNDGIFNWDIKNLGIFESLRIVWPDESSESDSIMITIFYY